MKNALESYDEEERLDATVSERHQNCKGCPIKQIKPDGSRVQQKCINCKKNTDWFCISCHHFACTPPRPEKFGEDVFRSEECITDGKVEELWG